MSLAALYSSPLMPWEETVGNRLAMEIMGGEYDPEMPAGLQTEGQQMMTLIRGRHEVPRSLGEALKLQLPLAPSDAIAGMPGARQPGIPRKRSDGSRERVPWEELTSQVPSLDFLGAGLDLTRKV
jgi:hypothetical protein